MSELTYILIEFEFNQYSITIIESNYIVVSILINIHRIITLIFSELSTIKSHVNESGIKLNQIASN